MGLGREMMLPSPRLEARQLSRMQPWREQPEQDPTTTRQKWGNAFCGMRVWVFWYWGEYLRVFLQFFLSAPLVLVWLIAVVWNMSRTEREVDARLEALESALHDRRERVRYVEQILEAHSSVTDSPDTLDPPRAKTVAERN
jgi:hypothetical protein